MKRMILGRDSHNLHEHSYYVVLFWNYNQSSHTCTILCIVLYGRMHTHTCRQAKLLTKRMLCSGWLWGRSIGDTVWWLAVLLPVCEVNHTSHQYKKYTNVVPVVTSRAGLTSSVCCATVCSWLQCKAGLSTCSHVQQSARALGCCSWWAGDLCCMPAIQWYGQQS